MSLQYPNLHFWQRRYLPLIVQTESAECGLACLVMIANFWGHKIDLSSIRRRFEISMKGSTLLDIVQIAEKLQFSNRPLKLELEQLSQLKCPCILHWDLKHFVVLKKVKNNYILIHDPAVGVRKITTHEASDHFTGIALELYPQQDFKPIKELRKFTLLSLMGQVEGLRHGLLQICLLGGALQVCNIVAPFYLQWIMDEAIVTANKNLISVLGIGFFLLVIFRASIEAVRSWVITVLSTDLNFQWLGNSFTHLLRLPLAWFEKRHLGDIVSRFDSIEAIQDGITTKAVESIIDGFLVVTTFMMMMFYSVKLSIITFIAVFIYLCIRWRVYFKQKHATADKIIHTARQETHFLESVRGIQTLRIFGKQKQRRIGWINNLVAEFNANLTLSRLNVIFKMSNTLLFGIERVLVIWFSAIMVLNNQFSIGMMIAFISYKDQFSQSIVSLIDNICDLSMLKVHGERVADMLLTQPENDLENNETNVLSLSLDIEIRDISFRYADNTPWIIKNMNLTIPAGQCIAITGSSGCGKSTLLKIILGLLEPTDGEILMGGIKISHIGLTNFRKILGTVMQEDQLFSGSIADNICFFDSSPDYNRISECASLASIHNDIISMPMAYNTLVGDIGTGLSGGQKQRILLARALYKRPLILALDEATSHLDIINEKSVNKEISNLNLTRLIIAHRQETIAMADRIIKLEQGTIISDKMQTCQIEEINKETDQHAT